MLKSKSSEKAIEYELSNRIDIIRYCNKCKYDVILSNTRPRSRVTSKPYLEIKITELQVLETLQQKKLVPVFARITKRLNLRGSTSEDFRDARMFCASKVDIERLRI